MERDIHPEEMTEVDYQVRTRDVSVEVAGVSLRADSVSALLRESVAMLDVRFALVVRLSSKDELAVETRWPETESLPAEDATLRVVNTRLLDVPEPLQHVPSQKNQEPAIPGILIHRFSDDPHSDDWRRALILVGRTHSPVRPASDVFLNCDYRVSRILVETIRRLEKSDFHPTIPSTILSLFSPVPLYDILQDAFGTGVQVWCSGHVINVRNMHLNDDLDESLSCRVVAERCISYMSAGMPDHIWLAKGNRLEHPAGPRYEFGVCLDSYPIHSRQVAVQMRAHSRNVDVEIPTGWWWSRFGPLQNGLDTSAAESKLRALFAQEGNGHVQMEFVRSVVWPDEPPLRIVHVFRVLKHSGWYTDYLVNAKDGTLVRTEECTRFEPSPAVENT